MHPVHSTPSNGQLFGHLAMMRYQPKNMRAYLDSLKARLSLGRLPDGSWHYLNPKRARMAIPGGGGWDGDTHLGRDDLALILAITQLSTKKVLIILKNAVDL